MAMNTTDSINRPSEPVTPSSAPSVPTSVPKPPATPGGSRPVVSSQERDAAAHDRELANPKFPRSEEQKKADVVLQAKVDAARLEVANLNAQKPWAPDTEVLAAAKAKTLADLLQEQVDSRKDHSAPLKMAMNTREEKLEHTRGLNTDPQPNTFESAYQPIADALKVTIEQLKNAIDLFEALRLKMTSRPFPQSAPKTAPAVIVNQIEGIQKLSSRVLEYYTQLLKLLNG